MNEQVVAWFQNEKGISPTTLEKFNIRYDPTDQAVVFPYSNGKEKRRYGVLGGSRRFSFTPGAELQLYNLQALRDQKQIFLCEGETDTLRLAQEMEDTTSAVVLGLPGVNSWKSEWAKYFKQADEVYVILDNDKDYNVQTAVDNSFRHISRDVGKPVRRLRLPSHVKDVAEFFAYHNLHDFHGIIHDSTNSRWSSVDFTTTPPSPAWVVEKLIAQGDIVLLIGEPGAGKSWLSMDLTIGLLNGDRRWLGHEIAIKPDSKILYLDEENPLDVVYSRFKKLGLLTSEVERLRYLHNVGVRLDLAPVDLIDEVRIWKPDLIVMDSFTRLHTIDENSAGAVAKLFNESIKPLARECGASVLILHHAGKGDGGSSYRRSRGSGDIVASVDAALDVRPVQAGIMSCYVFKSRRGLVEDPVTVRIQDMSDTKTEIKVIDNYDPF